MHGVRPDYPGEGGSRASTPCIRIGWQLQAGIVSLGHRHGELAPGTGIGSQSSDPPAMDEDDERGSKLVAESESGGRSGEEGGDSATIDLLLVLRYLTQQPEVGEGQLRRTVS